MQIIAPRTPAIARRRSIALGTLVGATLVIGGFTVAYMTFGTSFITRFMPGMRPEPSQMLAGMLAWTFALIAPAAFIMAGLARMAAVIDTVSRARPHTPTVRAARSLSDEYIVMPGVRLPDGRHIRELVVGPFGLAVIEEIPPAKVSRQRDGVWEIRMQRGRWIPIENPFERAANDAEHIRGWLSDEEQDFVAKVYAAVVAPDASLPRTAACAVVTSELIPSWLSSLPPQRSLTPMRREALVRLIREGRSGA